MKYISVREYAASKGVTERAIRNEIAKGRIKAEKIGKSWRIPVLNPEMLEEFK